MVRKTANAPDTEPNQFQMPSEGEHLFQVVDLIETDDPDILSAKLEVVGDDESGRTILHRLNLDEEWAGFFIVRLFLKAIGEPYKGKGFPIDSDRWIGRQFYATVVHNVSEQNGKTYANIDNYNFEKDVEQPSVTQAATTQTTGSNDQKAWDD